MCIWISFLILVFLFVGYGRFYVFYGFYMKSKRGYVYKEKVWGIFFVGKFNEVGINKYIV